MGNGKVKRRWLLKDSFILKFMFRHPQNDGEVIKFPGQILRLVTKMLKSGGFLLG